MTSTLKANSPRATIYMAFPLTPSTAHKSGQSGSGHQDDLGGLLAGLGPTCAELSIPALLGSMLRAWF